MITKKRTKKNKELKILALIAHDGKKAQMVAFVKDNLEFFKDYKIVATRTTGEHIIQSGLSLKPVLSGPLGGDAQIAALVATKKCDGVIFLRDPLGMHPHDPDISMLMRICDVHNVPLATNLASAQLLIKGLNKLERLAI